MAVKNMTLEQARGIAEDVAKTRLKWGKNGVPPYSVSNLLDAITLLFQAGDYDAVHEAEITKLRRQLAASNARVNKLAKKYKEEALSHRNGDYPG